MRRFVIPILLLAGWFPLGKSRAEVSSEQAKLDSQYQKAVQQARENHHRQREVLFERYAEAVERIQADFQKAGDLENALLAKKEITAARVDREPGEQEFPRIQPLRQTLVDQADKIRIAEAKELSELAGKLEELLEPLKLTLTRDGQLEAAVVVDRRLQELKQEVQELDRIAQLGAPAPERAALPRINTSILGQANPVTGEHRLEVGLYENIGRTSLGSRMEADPDDQGADIRITPGSVFRKGEIYLDVAKFNAQESLFQEIDFSQNLHSEFRAAGCLFDECTFAKGGGWGGKISSRWILSDCVFHESFFTEWRSRLTGVQASQCTFENIDLRPFGYTEDGGAEAIDEWWFLERCRFRDCSVPVSVLLASRDCILENSRIERDRFPIETRISVTVYYEGIEPEVPDMGELVTIKVVPAEKLAGKTGARIGYRLTRDGLEFDH